MSFCRSSGEYDDFDDEMGGEGDPEDPDRLVIADEHSGGKQEMAGSDYQTAPSAGHYNTPGSGMGQANEMKMKGEKPPRKKHNRFNGMSEEEVAKKLLPDLIAPDLDILIVS